MNNMQLAKYNELKNKVKLRNQMMGNLYWNITSDECCKLANECNDLGVERVKIEVILGERNLK